MDKFTNTLHMPNFIVLDGYWIEGLCIYILVTTLYTLCCQRDAKILKQTFSIEQRKQLGLNPLATNQFLTVDFLQ